MTRSPLTRRTRRRGGVTLVEMALLMTIFLLFLFGVFEYSRLLFLIHVTTNAARSAARYACCNVDKGSNFVTVNDATTGAVSIRQHVINQMGGADKLVTDFDVAAWPCNTTKLYQNPAVIEPKASYSAWNEATFTERIAVKVTGKYKPVLPAFIFMMSPTGTVDISMSAASGPEG